MHKRMNLLAIAVIAAGGAQLAHPARLSATLAPAPWLIQEQYCCEARTFGSGRPVTCCGANWCAIVATGCATG